MSSLLEEAIVDAKALKEAALKNAENTVLEKYSGEVKRALSTLLEQDEMGFEDEAPTADTTFTDSVPFAFANERIDGPAENELIEIDFDALKTRIEEEEAAGVETTADALVDTGEMADELSPAGELTEDGYITDTDLEDSAKVDAASEAGAADREDLDEDISISHDMLAELIEELVVDMTPRPQGWSSVNSADSSIEQANNDAMAAAQDAHLEEEEIEASVGTAPDVVSDAELFEAKIHRLTTSTKELKALLTDSKTQLTRLNLENAKLVYQNKALNSASLNERQKNKIVEAVQSANSVEEASMIFKPFKTQWGRRLIIVHVHKHFVKQFRDLHRF